MLLRFVRESSAVIDMKIIIIVITKIIVIIIIVLVVVNTHLLP